MDSGDRDTDQFRRDPSSSLEIGFGNFHSDDPVAVVVTLTPYSHGKPYPNAGKSLKILVNPRNPFPNGIHAENRNLTITYAADASGHSTFHPGSQFKIDWTDSLGRDSCVDLFLVQEDGQDKTVFRQQVIKQCLTPAKGGSYIGLSPIDIWEAAFAFTPLPRA